MVAMGYSVSPFAQQKKQCHAHTKNAHLMETNDDFRKAQEELEVFTQKYVEHYTPQQVTNHTKAAPRIINVVVHIVYEDASENFTDAQVIEAIDSLNNDFRGLNNDGLYNPSQAFFDLWADTEIAFKLASTDPDGNPTTGITRTQTSVTNFSANTDDMKFTSDGGKDGWPPQKYLNVWVCTYGAPTDLGYAYYPSALTTDPSIDGCVVNTPVFAIGGGLLGRTLTHEIGHYLNLDHIFGDESGCADDGVNDTPIPDNANYGCPNYPHNTNNGCAGITSEGEMFMNYMDYVDDNCMTMFTLGQSARMNAVLDGVRSALSDPNATLNVQEKALSTVQAFPNPVEASFFISIPNGANITSVYTVNVLGQQHMLTYHLQEDNIVINAEKLYPGVYTLFVDGEHEVITSKFMKQ